MPRCPHCGEIYRKGQEKCYACGQPVTGRGSGEGGINPLIYIIGGGVVGIVLLGFILATGNRAAVAREER
ncbi:MAG TPA: hypothetical protein ENN51_01030, partial [candidate division WOR-3 bacterium]|nr:hypothetical protein [candidate division WOR-3 bacterium]